MQQAKKCLQQIVLLSSNKFLLPGNTRIAMSHVILETGMYLSGMVENVWQGSKMEWESDDINVGQNTNSKM